ncbi:DUF1489 family protein [Stakelama marina]|uniref:DUF1489 domain-containing protein n=1 Tax=Stakelama marina TaxID=2826939 RepID=A0A8T4ILB9_9SPHN|nr:DUF1489 domain-containing protein [Stakelama marina]MBR0552956.1 DUF1489 domain-containing protein [Stakelama marina]
MHVPLHITKVAFGNPSVEHLAQRLAIRGRDGPMFLTTRYLPKRHEEIAGQGSLFWIIKHQLVARSPIIGFAGAEDGRTQIHIAPRVVRVAPQPKRAHQGWRYLEDKDAPADLVEAAEGIADLPPALVGQLTDLALI